MSKQRTYGRASLKSPFAPQTFYASVLRDLRKPLGPSYEVLRNTLFDEPEALRETAANLTDSTLCSIAEHGIYQYASLCQVNALLKKNVDWYSGTKEERSTLSKRKFFSSERDCRLSNKRLRHYIREYPLSRCPENINMIFNDAAMIVQEILGDLSGEVYGEILDHCEHGSGATFGSTEPEHRNLYYKIAGPHTVTQKALPHLRNFFSRNSHWYDYLKKNDKKYRVVNGNRVTFVPKDARTFRTIAIEPSLNMFLQKGVDRFLKKRLKKFNVNLRDQGANAILAKEGSVNGTFCTVDLSSASDTISKELVSLLLPKDWYELLDDLRSPCYTFDKGKTFVEYDKFSSQGNAFTFPLESIIFYAFSRSVQKACSGTSDRIKVYGDDIVIDTGCFSLLSEVFKFIGFTVNKEKSFVFGDFRETCGQDFVNGVDVRPVYLSSNPKSVPDLYNLYNRLILKCKFYLPRTLSYLRSLVSRAHIGPWYQGMGDKWRWDPMHSIELSSYFVTDPPSNRSYYHRDFQRRSWDNKILSYRPKDLVVDDNYVVYLMFLLGTPVERVKSTTRFRYHEVKVKAIASWPYISDIPGRKGVIL